ncbi:helix-turn-helix transcriptional regulator [Candidatus Haliotispira prima]|uniref:helix-turn-helix transcriptional regulator n=1 Tax=Candidatus Haliotispira prima TaxID=3034016 RepID=UPI00389901D0
MDIGQALKIIRERKDISQESLALESKISRRYMYSIEANKTNVSINRLEKICDVLEIKVSDLIALAENLDHSH